MVIPWAIVGVAALLMLTVIGGTISLKFLAVLFGVVALGLGVFLQYQGKDPKQALAIAGISLAVAFLFEVGWTTIIGIAIVAFALMKYSHFKRESYFLLILALGLILVLIGQYTALNVLGITP